MLVEEFPFRTHRMEFERARRHRAADGSDTGAAASAALRSAISPSFQCKALHLPGAEPQQQQQPKRRPGWRARGASDASSLHLHAQQMMAVLQRDEPAFSGRSIGDGAADDHRRPQHDMHPERRREFDLDQDRERRPRARRGSGRRRPPARRRHPAPRDRGRRRRSAAPPSGARRRACPRRSAGSGSASAATSGDRWTIAAAHSPALDSIADGGADAAPPVDADEEEQPHHVDEVPVPGRRLEAEMMVGREMALDARGPGRRRGRSCR